MMDTLILDLESSLKGIIQYDQVKHAKVRQDETVLQVLLTFPSPSHHPHREEICHPLQLQLASLTKLKDRMRPDQISGPVVTTISNALMKCRDGVFPSGIPLCIKRATMTTRKT